MGDGQTTGLITNIERDVIERVRQDCIDLASVLRGAMSDINGDLTTALQQAEIADWVSTARLTYDLGRSLLSGTLYAAALGCEYVASHYDDAVWLLDQQIALEFA